MKKLTTLFVLIVLAINIVYAQDVDPLIKTHWHQEAPYNNLCPKDSTGKRMLAGCGPIAMAQVVNYFGIRKDTLQLIRDCGVSAFTNYRLEGSSTKTDLCENALKKQFGLSKYMNIVYAYDYKSPSREKEFQELIFNEIRHGRPVIVSAKKSDDDFGHLFILDGIWENYVHVNMGWGGVKDAYYPLDNIAGYTNIQSIIVDISTDDYLPEQSVFNVDKPGTLKTIMMESGKQNARHIKIEGSINKNDIEWLRKLSMYDKQTDCGGSIKTLDLSNTDMVYLPDSSFLFSQSLVYVKLPKNLHTIGLDAFKWSFNLNNVDIPQSVRKIRMGAFYKCGNLLDVEIPNGVNKVLSHSFEGCVFLTDVKLPSTIDTIGSDAFADCSRLVRLEIPAATKHIGPQITRNDKYVNVVINPNNAYFYSKNGIICRKEDDSCVDNPKKDKKKIKSQKYFRGFVDGYAYRTTYKIVNGKKVMIKSTRIK